MSDRVCPACGSDRIQFINYGEINDVVDQDAMAIYYSVQEIYTCEECGQEFEIEGIKVEARGDCI